MENLETFSETSTPETPETETPEKETPSLADLLKDPEPETAEAEGEAGESPQDAEPPGEKPKALKDLAERLKLEAKDLYDVEVPLSDGKAVSLGELKDAYGKQEDLTRRELEFEEQKATKEADWTRSQAELRALIQALPPKAISEQALQLVRERAEKELTTEREMTLRTIPEWADETRRESELQGMVELLGDYGFPANYLQSALNHRFIRFVRDSYLRKQRIEKALGQVKEVKRTSTTGKSTPNGAARKAASKKPTASGSGPESRLMALLNE